MSYVAICLFMHYVHVSLNMAIYGVPYLNGQMDMHEHPKISSDS